MIKRGLTIAGSDSGGGAGIQADLKTFADIGIYGMSTITAVTAQNTVGVQGIHQLPADFVAMQIDSVMSDLGADGIKVGMLGSAEVVATVAERLEFYNLEIVVIDPVIVATSGDLLLEKEAVETIKNKLIPQATIITPNRHEAEVLVGRKIKDKADLHYAARSLSAMGAKGVLIKGGHLDFARKETRGQGCSPYPSRDLDGKVVDVFYDGQKYYEFSKEKIETENTHGTGCTLSSALMAYLCTGMATLTALAAAKDYVHEKIKFAQENSLGKGAGPICLPKK